MVERRHKIVFAVLLACFALFGVQLVNIQAFGNTKPLTLARGTSTAPIHQATKHVTEQKPTAKAAGPAVGTGFKKFGRMVQAKLGSVPRKARSLAQRLFKRLGAA